MGSAETMNFSLIDTIRLVVAAAGVAHRAAAGLRFLRHVHQGHALASQIGVIELTYVGKVLNNKGFSAALSFGVILIVYFLISYPLSRLGAHLEARLASSRHRRA